MVAGRPLTPRQRAEILRRHAKGETRNSIAKTLGLSGSTVSKVVATEGGSFARGEEVAAATEARKVDLAALRAQLAIDLTMDAMKLRAQLWQPTTVYAFGGKENIYEEHTFPQAPAAEKRALMGTAGMAIDRSLKLAPAETDVDGLAAVDAWLKGMMGG